MESILTTTTLTLGGNYIEVLADEADAEKDWELMASVHPVWTENAYEGLGMEDAVTENPVAGFVFHGKGKNFRIKVDVFDFNLKI